MIVDITDSGVTLTDPDDLRRFHSRVPAGVTDDAVDAVLARTGAGHRVGADQVAVNVTWLRAVGVRCGRELGTVFSADAGFRRHQGLADRRWGRRPGPHRT